MAALPARTAATSRSDGAVVREGWSTGVAVLGIENTAWRKDSMRGEAIACWQRAWSQSRPERAALVSAECNAE